MYDFAFIHNVDVFECFIMPSQCYTIIQKPKVYLFVTLQNAKMVSLSTLILTKFKH